MTKAKRLNEKNGSEAGHYDADGRLRTVYGYDANGYSRGDRVELHPGCDLWMRGAKYGTVLAIVDTKRDQVRVELDRFPGRRFSGPADRFRRID